MGYGHSDNTSTVFDKSSWNAIQTSVGTEFQKIFKDLKYSKESLRTPSFW